ncbi:MAG: hypothetical protein ACK52J_00200 [bacterium]
MKSRGLKFPHCDNKVAINLIELLLSKVPVNRLKGSYSNLKSHGFFIGFDWVFKII